MLVAAFIAGYYVGYNKGKNRYKVEGVLYGKDAKNFYERFVKNSKIDPARVKQNKIDVEIYKKHTIRD